jgi:serine/threonine protein kinase
MFGWLSPKTHPIPPPSAEDFSLKPMYPPSFGLRQLDLLETVGTGSFGRVRLVKNIEDKTYHALKIMKKAKIVRLNQVCYHLLGFLLIFPSSSTSRTNSKFFRTSGAHKS